MQSTNAAPRVVRGQRLNRVVLLILELFLGVTATIGGIGILADWWGLSPDWLDGSPFSNYTVPGLALVAVGAIALVGAFLLLRYHPTGLPISVAAGTAIVIYELVEAAVVPYHWLQVFYAVLGLLIILIAGWIMKVSLRRREDSHHRWTERRGASR